MPRVSRIEREVLVHGDDVELRYTPTAVTLSDGRRIAHESQGGELSAVWADDLGDAYVEVVHLGDGPHGGELVLVVPSEHVVAVGDLWTSEVPTGVSASWPAAIDLALGLTTATTTILTTEREIARDELEAFHQRLLGVLHG